MGVRLIENLVERPDVAELDHKTSNDSYLLAQMSLVRVSQPIAYVQVEIPATRDVFELREKMLSDVVGRK